MQDSDQAGVDRVEDILDNLFECDDYTHRIRVRDIARIVKDKDLRETEPGAISRLEHYIRNRE